MKTLQYFANCLTLETLTKERNRLALIHHPDKGGDLATMQEINAQFETAKKQLSAPAPQRQWFNPVPKPAQTPYERGKEWAARKEQERLAREQEARTEELREIWQDVHKAEQQGLLRNCNVHYKAGEFLIVGGHTYPYREWLKSHGFIWMPQSRNWHFNKRPTNRKEYEDDYSDY